MCDREPLGNVGLRAVEEYVYGMCVSDDIYVYTRSWWVWYIILWGMRCVFSIGRGLIFFFYFFKKKEVMDNEKRETAEKKGLYIIASYDASRLRISFFFSKSDEREIRGCHQHRRPQIFYMLYYRHTTTAAREGRVTGRHLEIGAIFLLFFITTSSPRSSHALMIG